MTLFEWYLARASGMVAFVLLTIAVVLGLTLSGRARLRYWPRFAVEDVHRFAGLLTGTFVSLHVLMLFVDSYLPFSITQLAVPGTSSYRPLATALGVVAAELLLALAITNRYRKRLSHRFWRRAHYLNFGVWGLALLHGIFAGTDRGAPWADALYGCSAAAVAGFVAWRARGGLRPPAATPSTASTARAG
jgi:sulfoxide reductase heme-binding subunit YedZ